MTAVAPRLPSEHSASAPQLIAGFLQDFSIEATRPTEADIATLKSAAPAGMQIFLSAVPTHPLNELVAYSARVRAAGFEPVPHVAARNLESSAAFDDLLAELVAKAGVRRVLIIGGDRDQAQGPYSSAAEAIESGLLQRHGITEVGISGYPEGHPRISNDVLDRALTNKIEAAEQTGLAVRIVTQFGFSAAPILNWILRMRDLGIEQEIRIGMAGPTNIATLLRFARRCGVSASAQGLTRQAGLLKHLVGTSAPDGIVRPVAEAGGNLGKVGAHFFSFGGAAATVRWAQAVVSGRITLDRADGFRVESP